MSLQRRRGQSEYGMISSFAHHQLLYSMILKVDQKFGGRID